MWEITYNVSPHRGYFDRGEKALCESGVYIEAAHSMDFVSDGSVVMVYEVDGSVETLREVLERGGEKVVDYVVTNHCDPLVAQIRFQPDEVFGEILSTHQSYGLSVEFPIRYVGYDPVTIELVQVGPREELSDRIEATKQYATVDIQQIHRYDPSTRRLFRELTDRQQEVLTAAMRKGYYRTPREATHEDIAEELSCSASVVGQHLRRIERKLVSLVVPGGMEEDAAPSARGD